MDKEVRESASLTGAAEFALRVLEEVAPEEAPAFEPAMTEHVRRARKRLRNGGRKRHQDIPNSSGTELADVLAPAVIYVCVKVGDALAAGATKPVSDATERTVTGLFSRVARRPRPTAEPLPSQNSRSAQQLSAIHAEALAAGLHEGLPEARAKALADAIVARLSMREGE
ncbi:hypothetical protein [Streptomyces europaeiscabiei]|uniref:hypothetical protein n=1 Tax=Streptomyces europaeiscabiei TaxID=146819 RepID=UPI0029A6CE7A|nr:hypothetical protein [Streptomyces europaeiscabiei]MDX3848512.1 hypothetical protein [Streptomyces europaeiscabiei]